jgi:hypothetical protein
MQSTLRPCFPSLLALSLIATPATWAVDFVKDVQPVLREKCGKCHNGPDAKKGLRYDDAATLAKFIGMGEDTVITPGKPDESRLIKLASLPRDDSDAMPPPSRGEGLSAPELTLVRQWITEGAKLGDGTSTTPAPSTPTQPPKLLGWTNVEGRTLNAYFVKLDGKNVVLKKEDGSEFTYPMSQLSAESRKQATDLSAR